MPDIIKKEDIELWIKNYIDQHGTQTMRNALGGNGLAWKNPWKSGMQGICDGIADAVNKKVVEHCEELVEEVTNRVNSRIVNQLNWNWKVRMHQMAREIKDLGGDQVADPNTIGQV